jgi:hypothetical protein
MCICQEVETLTIPVWLPHVRMFLRLVIIILSVAKVITLVSSCIRLSPPALHNRWQRSDRDKPIYVTSPASPARKPVVWVRSELGAV